MEQELVKQKQVCGALYLKMVTCQATPTEMSIYDSAKSKLADMMSEIAIVEQMIADGHEWRHARTRNSADPQVDWNMSGR